MKNWIPIWVIPVLIIFATGTVWLRLLVIRMTYAIGQTDREMAKVRQERELIQIKMASLKSPKRLEILAKSRFGLGQPQMSQVIHLPSNNGR